APLVEAIDWSWAAEWQAPGLPGRVTSPDQTSAIKECLSAITSALITRSRPTGTGAIPAPGWARDGLPALPGPRRPGPRALITWATLWIPRPSTTITAIM